MREYAAPMNAQHWCHNPGCPSAGVEVGAEHSHTCAQPTPRVVRATSVFSLMNTVWDDEALVRHQGPLPLGHKDINRWVLLGRASVCHVARPTEDSGGQSGPDPDMETGLTPALVMSLCSDKGHHPRGSLIDQLLCPKTTLLSQEP